LRDNRIQLEKSTPNELTISISDVVLADEGEYTCSIFTMPVRTAKALVTVLGTARAPPVPPLGSPQEFLWEKEGSEAPLQLSSDSVLIFPFLNKSDSGTYVCTATSAMGSVVAKYNLDVSGEGTP
ncbi:cell adhesion molecule 3-like, partial [Corapipo altera]|uniref:cell adhesion molecule 3-like n=1 Tax=Corapipo altera TaxID=415028 RepID=UPI000FD69F98